MLPLDEQTRLTTQLFPEDGGSARVEIHSRSASGHWKRHAVARLALCEADAPTAPPATAGGGATLSPKDFYTALRRTGAHHGQAFAALTRIVRNPGGPTEDFGVKYNLGNGGPAPESVALNLVVGSMQDSDVMLNDWLNR